MTKHITKSEAWSTVIPHAGAQFRILEGTVWVTQEADPEDHVLVGPAVFSANRQGRLAVVAITAADVQLDAAA